MSVPGSPSEFMRQRSLGWPPAHLAAGNTMHVAAPRFVTAVYSSSLEDLKQLGLANAVYLKLSWDEF